MNGFHRVDAMDSNDRVTRRIKMGDLRMLLAVAQWGSMSKAASKLNITQSAVSKALTGLEHTLGVRLLDRNPQGVEPTSYGRALLNRGVAIFDELQQGVKDIQFLADPTGGEVRIGIGPPFGGLLSNVIERLALRYPKMTFRVVERDMTALVNSDLRGRMVDVVLGWARPIDDETFNADILFDDKRFVVAGTTCPWIRRRKIALAELVGERWILPPLTGLAGSHVAEDFVANGLQVPRISISVNSTSIRDRLLATGRYLAVVPGVELRFRDKAAPYKVLPVSFGVNERPVGIVTLKQRTFGPAVQIFIDEVRAVAKRMNARLTSRIERPVTARRR
jgi:DNA-binding transcriptional LysR family regulator